MSAASCVAAFSSLLARPCLAKSSRTSGDFQKFFSYHSRRSSASTAPACLSWLAFSSGCSFSSYEWHGLKKAMRALRSASVTDSPLPSGWLAVQSVPVSPFFSKSSLYCGARQKFFLNHASRCSRSAAGAPSTSPLPTEPAAALAAFHFLPALPFLRKSSTNSGFFQNVGSLAAAHSWR